jgi:hypothetical protein
MQKQPNAFSQAFRPPSGAGPRAAISLSRVVGAGSWTGREDFSMSVLGFSLRPVIGADSEGGAGEVEAVMFGYSIGSVKVIAGELDENYAVHLEEIYIQRGSR